MKFKFGENVCLIYQRGDFLSARPKFFMKILKSNTLSDMLSTNMRVATVIKTFFTSQLLVNTSFTYFFTRGTSMSEGLLITWDAYRLIFMWDVILSTQWLVAMPAAKMLQMPIGIFRLCVFGSENQLKTKKRLNESKSV